MRARPVIVGRNEAALILSRIGQLGEEGQNEMIRAAANGMCALLLISKRDIALTNADLARCPSLPLLVVIGDDYAAPVGPKAWRCARYATAWARAAVVHGSGASPQTYGHAIAAAVLTGRGLLIETGSAHVHDWAALVRDKPALAIVPPDGGVHPIAPRPESLQ